jgi:hypothetical protein
MAYSAHNKHIGYCQSMNYVAAMLLLGLDKNEENAFWALATLIEDLLYPNTYSSQLTGCHVEMRCAGEGRPGAGGCPGWRCAAPGLGGCLERRRAWSGAPAARPRRQAPGPSRPDPHRLPLATAPSQVALQAD